MGVEVKVENRDGGEWCISVPLKVTPLSLRILTRPSATLAFADPTRKRASKFCNNSEAGHGETRRHDDMSRRTDTSSNHEIYPKRYFDAAPTWFAWNNLTAADVNSLRTESGFEGQQIYFHLNHPIRFVRLVGLLVDIEVKAGKCILLSLDDSSGACLEIKTTIRPVKEDDHAEYPSNTLVDNLDCHINLGVPSLHINKQTLDVGTVIKVKGSLDSFRDTRQLKLERIWIVKDTNEEAKTWAETASWKQNILAKPWVLPSEQKAEIDEDIRQNELKDRERSKKRRAFDAKHAEKKRRKLEKTELKRKADEEKYNAGALPGSSILPTRITDS